MCRLVCVLILKMSMNEPNLRSCGRIEEKYFSFESPMKFATETFPTLTCLVMVADGATPTPRESPTPCGSLQNYHVQEGFWTQTVPQEERGRNSPELDQVCNWPAQCLLQILVPVNSLRANFF